MSSHSYGILPVCEFVSKFPLSIRTLVILDEGPPKWPHFNLIALQRPHLQIRSHSEVVGVGWDFNTGIGGVERHDSTHNRNLPATTYNYVFNQEVSGHRPDGFLHPFQDLSSVPSSCLSERVCSLRQLKERKMLGKVTYGFSNRGWQDLNQEGQSLVPRLEGNLKWGVSWETCIYKEAIYYT